MQNTSPKSPLSSQAGMGKKDSLVKEEDPEVKSEFSSISGGEKRAKIRKACLDRDLDTIASLALSTDGLLADDIRQEVCEFG